MHGECKMGGLVAQDMRRNVKLLLVPRDRDPSFFDDGAAKDDHIAELQIENMDVLTSPDEPGEISFILDYHESLDSFKTANPHAAFGCSWCGKTFDDKWNLRQSQE